MRLIIFKMYTIKDYVTHDVTVIWPLMWITHIKRINLVNFVYIVIERISKLWNKQENPLYAFPLIILPAT
jgi:hypothetical protein